MIDLNKLQTFNTDINHVFHGKIIECDMKGASLQIADVFNLLPKEKIEYLRNLPKNERVVQTGLIQKENPEFSDAFHNKLLEVRRHFIEQNKIKDDEIIAIHSDAIWVNTKRELQYIIDNIEFTSKNKFTSYIRFHNIEILYNDDDGSVVYKGVPKQLLEQHSIGLCRHILKVFQMIENDDDRIFDYLSTFQSQYLKWELNDNCYLPFAKVNGDRFSENLELLSFLCNIAIKEC